MKQNNINIRSLKPGDIDDFLEIELEAFYKKIIFVFSGDPVAARAIVRAELVDNINTGRYYNALSDGRPVGTIEFVSKENSEIYRRSFLYHYKYLGLITEEE